MRILLISDIHGRFDLFVTLARSTGADAVICAGDLQLESHDHLDRLGNRELFLRIVHSPYEAALKTIKRDDRKALEAIVLEHGLCGSWDGVLAGRIEFPVPVYAVWGNHEDTAFVRQADAGAIQVSNLTFLTGKEDVLLDGWIRIVGIGSNLLVADFLGKEIITPRNNITSTLARYGRVFDRWRAIDRGGEFRVFVQHVSPQKDRACANPLMHIAPDLVVSSHMGAPYPHQFSLFGTSAPADIEPLHREPADRLLREARAIFEAGAVLSSLDAAAQCLEEEGPAGFKARYERGEGHVAVTLASYLDAGIPDPARRYSVALSGARNALANDAVSRHGIDSAHVERLADYAALLEPPEQFIDLDGDPSHRHKAADASLKRLNYLNLPDAGDGYVVLEADSSLRRMRTESFGTIPAAP